MRVIDVDSPGPAERAGVRVGDRFDSATSFENRLYLQSVRNSSPGQRVAFLITSKNGAPRTINLLAETGEWDASVVPEYFMWVVVDLVFVVVGSILVLLRPSVMTWAFFLYCIGTAPGFVLGFYWLPAWLVFATGGFVNALQALGLAALLVFCVRVPNDRSLGGWRYLEWIGAPLVFVSTLSCSAVIQLSIAGALHADVAAGRIQWVILDATYVAGLLALFATFAGERGPDRSRIGWIVVGFTIALGSVLATNLLDTNASMSIYTGLSSSVPWLPLVPALQVALPLTVAYAVIRHHALNVGFVANRTIVYGLFLCAGFAAFALLDLLATKKFANNEFEIGLDVAIALVMGLSFQFVHPRAIRLIDRIFLPQRYHAAIAMDKLRNSLRLFRNQDGGPNRAVEAVAKELMLSSLAIFKKVPDGGFVRLAAAGWPKGSAWHIFAEDPLLQSFGSSRRVRFIDETSTERLKVPMEPGRPSAGMSLSPQTADESLLLVGAHANGRRPDRDEVSGIASLLREFATMNAEGPG